MTVHVGRAGRTTAGRARWAARLVGAAVFAAAGGCVTTPQAWVGNGLKVGPNYKAPPAPTADAWIEANDPRVKSSPAQLAGWWKVFNDPVLDALVQKAYQQNLDVKTAGTRILQARAIRGVAIGEFFPQVQQAIGSYSSNYLSGNVANPPPNLSFGEWAGGFNVSWELDLWGRFRRGIEVADANLNASIENYDNVLVVLLADVATQYVQIRNYQQQLAYVRENVRIQKGSLDIANARFQGGQVTELDVSQATANLMQTESLIPALEINLRQANNRLCVLLGEPPRDLLKDLGAGPIPAAPAEVALGVPADLLRRRPDIRRAERELAAACARIGVAEAELYPAFFFNGNVQVQTEQFVHLFDNKSLAASFGPSFQWNILNYGRIINKVRLQDATFQELLITYQNNVLGANQEVENTLVGFLRSQEQARALHASAQAAATSVSVANTQYDAGQVNFNLVFFLENFLVQQQLNEAAARANVALFLIGVYKSLGGGWQIRLDPRHDVAWPATSQPASQPASRPVTTPDGAPLPKPEDVPASRPVHYGVEDKP